MRQTHSSLIGQNLFIYLLFFYLLWICQVIPILHSWIKVLSSENHWTIMYILKKKRKRKISICQEWFDKDIELIVVYELKLTPKIFCPLGLQDYLIIYNCLFLNICLIGDVWSRHHLHKIFSRSLLIKCVISYGCFFLWFFSNQHFFKSFEKYLLFFQYIF